jgi:hypothetical protein
MMETSNVPIRQPREPPAAVKVVWRRFVKTLLSCGKNVACAAGRAGQ